MSTIVSSDTGNWIDTSTWVGGVVPVSGDDARVGDGHIIAITANVTGANSVDSLAADTVSGSLVFDNFIFTSSGIIDLEEITATSAGATITATSVDVGANGSLTLSADTIINGDFLRSGGVIVPDGFDIIVSGNVSESAGTGKPNITMLNVGGKSIGWNDTAGKIGTLTVPSGSAISSTTAVVQCGKLRGSGEIALNHDLEMTALASGWWDYSGTITGSGGVVVFLGGNNTPGTVPINVDVPFRLLTSAGDRVVALGASLTTSGLLWVQGNANGTSVRLDTVTYSLCFDTARLGDTNTSGAGILLLGTGSHAGGDIADGFASNAGNAIDFETSMFIASGTIDGDNIAVSSTNARIRGGSIVNVDNSGSPNIYAIGSVDGENNDSVIFMKSGWNANQNVADLQLLLLTDNL